MLPAPVLFTILEASLRWGCTQTHVVNASIAHGLNLVAAFAPVKLGEKLDAGLLHIAGSEVRPLFRPFGSVAKKVYVLQARLTPAEDWQMITKPARGVKLAAADILITSREIDRFEEAHGIARIKRSSPGAPVKYDWEGFYFALLKRSFTGGFPAKQSDLVAEMQDWFIANSRDGDAPDESTIRRRIQTIWKEILQA